jgi:cupin fold WbuC family metalloprotein
MIHILRRIGKPGRRKSYLILEGDFSVFFFDDQVTVLKRLDLFDLGKGKFFYVRFDASVWHTVLLLSEVVVYLKIIAGTFESTEFAHWALDKTDVQGLKDYFSKLEAYN